MHKPKLVKLLLLLLVIGSLWSAACSKRNEQDPFTVQFLTLRKRIIGEWHMKKILIDGQDFSHLIEMENDTFFSVYNIFTFENNSNPKGKMEVSTQNGKFLIDRYVYPSIVIYYNTKRKNSEIKFTRFNPIRKYGPINNFYYSSFNNPPTWEIYRLTKKEMFLQTIYNNQKYELYFDKK